MGVPLRPLDPAWPKAERLGWWFFDAVVFLATASGILVLMVHDEFEFLAWVGVASAWGLLMGVFVWATLAYPDAAFRCAGVAEGDFGIEYRRGVWWRKTTIIPRSRVQHTDVSQGPIMRRFGLGKLVIHTAGTRNAVVEINGLALADAERIRDRLLGERPGVSQEAGASDEATARDERGDADGV